MENILKHSRTLLLWYSELQTHLSVFHSAKQPSLQPGIPSPPVLLVKALTLTARLFELLKNRLLPEGGAHIPRNRGQALNSTVRVWATPRNPATLLQNHYSKTTDQRMPNSPKKQSGTFTGVTSSVTHWGLHLNGHFNEQSPTTAIRSSLSPYPPWIFIY